MNVLRVQLEASAGFYLNPLFHLLPTGDQWPKRVEAWRESFLGSGWQMLGTPTTLGFRSMVYVGGVNPVTERQLDPLRLNWSDRVMGVKVTRITLVPNIGTASVDKTLLQQDSLLPAPLSLGGRASTALTVLSVVAIIGVGLYALNKAQGTLSYD